MEFDLKAAVDYALEHNPELQQQRLELDRARSQVSEAVAGAYPKLSLTGSYGYISELPIMEFQLDPTQPPVVIPMGRHANYALKATMQQPIFTWGQLYRGYEITDINYESSKRKLERKVQEVSCQVKEGFYGLLLAERMVELTQQGLDRAEQHLKTVEKRYRAGMVPDFELLRAQVQVANIRPQLARAENGLKLAQEGFKLLLGTPLDAELKLHGEFPMPDFELPKLTDCLTEALENRLELKNLNATIAMAQHRVLILRSARLPILVGTASYEYKRPFQFAADEWGSDLIFGLGFSLPIFDGFKTRAAIEAAEIDLKRAVLAQASYESFIQLEVKEAYLSFEAAQEAVEVSEETVAQARKGAEIVETRYQNGLATNLEVFDAQLALMQAETNRAQALCDYAQARARLELAIGKED
jgi:outer membrane protein TolC